MHRTQISLEEKQYHNLRQFAQNQQQSISAVIRKLLDQHVPDIKLDNLADNPLQQLKGIVSGDSEFRGSDHNKQLYKNERRWNSKQP